MKISFISPAFNIIEEGYGAGTKKKKYGYWLPFGLAVLAACVKKAGHEVQVIDASVNDFSNSEILNRVNDFRPDVIGISALLATKRQALGLAEAIRKELPKSRIFLGGPLASAFTDEALIENRCIDFLLAGETEQTLPELMTRLEHKRKIDDIPGLIYRQGNKVARNPKPEPIRELDTLPHPAWELFELEKYLPLPLQYRGLPIVPYLSSRGCPYKRCAFCYESGKASATYRRHSPEYVIEDVKRLVNDFGVKEIAFWDDIFLVNEHWVLRFCELLHKEKIKVHWQVYAHNAMVTRRMLEAAAKAGCWNVFYGIESGNQDLLNDMHKGVTLRRIKETVKWTHEVGMDTRGSFVLALPGEDPRKAMRTIDFAIQLDLTFVQFVPLFPEFGTEIYEAAMKKGIIADEYKGRTTAQYVPNGYKDAGEVEKMQKIGYRKFYFRPGYIMKHLKRVIAKPALMSQYIEAMGFIANIGFKK